MRPGNPNKQPKPPTCLDLNLFCTTAPFRAPTFFWSPSPSLPLSLFLEPKHWPKSANIFNVFFGRSRIGPTRIGQTRIGLTRTGLSRPSSRRSRRVGFWCSACGEAARRRPRQCANFSFHMRLHIRYHCAILRRKRQRKKRPMGHTTKKNVEVKGPERASHLHQTTPQPRGRSTAHPSSELPSPPSSTYTLRVSRFRVAHHVNGFIVIAC